MNWLNRALHRRKLESQLDKELQFHLDQHAADLIERGVPEHEARRRARMEISGPEQVKERCRDARGTRWIEDICQDVRYAARMLLKQRSFAAVTLATLGLGIGATTVMFTVVNSVLLRPLPFPDPQSLAAVSGRLEGSRFTQQFLAYPDFLDCQRQAHSIELGGWVYDSATLSEPGEAEYEQVFRVSHNLFSVLGVPMFRGRPFFAEEDRQGATPAAILGYSLWQRRFGADDGAIGRALVLDGRRYTIVGVAPRGMQLDGEADVYTPLGQETAAYLQQRRAHPVRGIARLHEGTTLARAQAEIGALGRSLAQQYPDSNRGRALVVRPLVPDVAGVRSTLWLLLGAVTLVLLISCANVASLMLARAVSRGRELAMRAALGAGRGRLARQCLTESAVLGLGGGLLGVGLAAAGLRPLIALWPGDLPRANEVHLDWRVLAFAVAISLVSGLIFGLAPAVHVPSRALERILREGARGIASGSRRLHGGFVASEIALALVLLVSAGMLGHAILRLSALDPGVDTHNVLVARAAISPSALSQPGAIRATWTQVMEQTRSVPGVQSAALVDTVPMREGHNENTYWPSATLPVENQRPAAISTCVTPDYFKVMGLRLRAGRFFTEHDRLDSQGVIVIDDVLARNAFPATDAVGHQLWVPDFGDKPLLVVGVVDHVRYWGLASDDQSALRAQFYYPFAQVPDAWLRRWSQLMSIAVRTTVPPLSTVPALRHAIRGASNDQVLYEVRTLEQLAADSLSRQRFLLLLFAIFAGLSLLLACIGMYGVLAYLTGLRVREFGVRMALGASAGDVRGLVFRQSLGMMIAGVVVGGAAAITGGRVLQKVVDGIQPMDGGTLGLMTGILVAAALLATFIPAIRASRIDPMRALRQD